MDLSILSACFSCLILLPTTTTHYHQLIYIYLFQVCIANPPESLTSAGCAPQFPPGCDCDPAADDPNSSCPANSQCVQCKCLPKGCDCDPQAEDPSSFCPADEICKVRFYSNLSIVNIKSSCRTALASPPSPLGVTVTLQLMIPMNHARQTPSVFSATAFLKAVIVIHRLMIQTASVL